MEEGFGKSDVTCPKCRFQAIFQLLIWSTFLIIKFFCGVKIKSSKTFLKWNWSLNSKKWVSSTQNQVHFRYDVIIKEFGQIWVNLEISLFSQAEIWESNKKWSFLCRFTRGIRKNWFRLLKISVDFVNGCFWLIFCRLESAKIGTSPKNDKLIIRSTCNTSKLCIKISNDLENNYHQKCNFIEGNYQVIKGN